MICPNCKQDVEPSAVKFTWWGGVLGPKMLSHVECPACRARFNGKTGQPNTTGILIYTVVIAVIAFAIMFAVMR